MAVQRLRKSGPLYRCVPLGVLCALSMIAFNSAPAAKQAAVPENGSGQQSDAVRPTLVHDGALSVPHYPLEIQTYRGAKNGKIDSSDIDKDTPYFHEPLIYFRKGEDGRLINDYDSGILTLYVAMNTLGHQTREEVKTYLQEDKGIPEADLPHDANIQPLSVRGWFESSANEEIRSKLWDVSMSSRSGPDFSVHFPMPSGEAASRFLSRLHPEKEGEAAPEQLLFKYSLRGDAIEVCTVHASAETMTGHRRFQELAGDASGDGRYVSRDQIANLMSEIGRHESISIHCRTESVAKQLREAALKRLDDKVESGFTIDNLDRLTDSVQDDIRVDIDNATKKIEAQEEREHIQKLSQEVKSGAIGFGLFVKAIVEAIPFAGELKVDTSTARGKAYQSMWDSLSRVHDQLEWDGKRHRPKTVDVYRKEELRNALNTSIQFRHETPKNAEDVRFIPISKEHWIADDKDRPSPNSPLAALSARLIEAEARLIKAEERLVAAQEKIETLVTRVETPRLGTDSRPDRSGVWVKGADLQIDAEADWAMRDGRMRTVGGDVEIEAEANLRLDGKNKIAMYNRGYRPGDDPLPAEARPPRGDIAIEARDDIDIEAGDEIEIDARGGIDINFGGGTIDMDSGNKRITIRSGRRDGTDRAFLKVSPNFAQIETRGGGITINGSRGTIELDADRVTVNGRSLVDIVQSVIDHNKNHGPIRR